MWISNDYTVLAGYVPYSIPYIIHWLNEFAEPISYDTVCTFGGSYDMVHCNMPTWFKQVFAWSEIGDGPWTGPQLWS